MIIVSQEKSFTTLKNNYNLTTPKKFVLLIICLKIEIYQKP